jgi:arylsulfatase A-like enzyme
MGFSRVVSLRAAALLALPGLAVGLLWLGCGDAPRPNVLLVTLDTTRADHLGAYGHWRDTSPHFDALAREGTLYTHAYSTSSWTLPSHASLFTGKFPSSHGARLDPQGPMRLGSAIADGGGIRARGLSPDEPTLASRLSDAGYATAGFVAGPWLMRNFGLSKGFEHWDDDGILDVNGRPAERLADAVLAWLSDWADASTRRPFFLFVNFFDAHYPYAPPAEYAHAYLPPDTLANTMDRAQFDPLYDAEIRYADEQLGRLLDFLRQRGLYDDTLVIVTADHGEMLGEHGDWGHNGILFEPLVRVPLVVKRPGEHTPHVDDTPIQHPGVFDLMLSAAGLDPPAAPRPRLAEVFYPRAPGLGEWKVIWDGDLKYMAHSDGDDRLYDLARDRRERVNRTDAHPDQVRQMREELDETLAALPAPLPGDDTPVEIDARTREALERLGYLDAPGAEAPGQPPAGPPADPPTDR